MIRFTLQTKFAAGNETTQFSSQMIIKQINPRLVFFAYATLLALLAILGHKSAHSFETGPVIALPAQRKGELFYLVRTALREHENYSPSQYSQAQKIIPNRGQNAPFISPLTLTITAALSSKPIT